MSENKDKILDLETAEVADDEVEAEEIFNAEETAPVEETAEEANEAEEYEDCETETVVVEKGVVEYDDNDDIGEIEEMLNAEELNRKRTRRAAIGVGIAAVGIIAGIAAKIIRGKRK